ncbi:hypothetical protein WOLCODRAFT_28760, partial [Wolfiporia cocos MD-104 SS10]
MYCCSAHVVHRCEALRGCATDPEFEASHTNSVERARAFHRRGAVADRACSRVAFATADENVTSTLAYTGAFGGRYQGRKRTADIINASRPCHLAL